MSTKRSKAEFIKIVHNENLIQYAFLEKLDRVTYNTSIYVWCVGKNAVMIDAGYYRYGLSVYEDLMQDQIIVDKLIVTHYHKDHAEGSIVFKTSDIIASSNYKSHFNVCQDSHRPGHKYPIPTVLVYIELEFNFYGTAFKIIETPGHTPCGLSVIIDKDYLHVGDMLLEDIDGKIIIPYMNMSSNIKDHIQTLRHYKDLNPKHLIFSHGKVKFDVNLENQLNERIYYLEHFTKYDYKNDLENCLLQDVEKYSMTIIDKLNKRNAKKTCQHSQPVKLS